jgi:hypothetical protein
MEFVNPKFANIPKKITTILLRATIPKISGLRILANTAICPN